MTQQKSLTARSWAELLLLALIWGASFLSNRVALNETGVFTIVAWRVGGACLVLWTVVALHGLSMPRGPRIWGAFVVMGILNNVLPFSLITWGQMTIPSGTAAILNASTALMGVVVASVLFRDERLTVNRLAGVAVGFAGVVTVIGWQALTVIDLHSLSQLALLAASLSYACAGAWARRQLGGLPPLVAAAGMLTGSSLVMIPLALAIEGLPVLHHSAATWAALGYLAVVATAGAYMLYYRVLAAAGAGNLSLVTLLVAPFAILLGALVLGETLPPRAYAGFAILAAGLLLIDGRVMARWHPPAP